MIQMKLPLSNEFLSFYFITCQSYRWANNFCHAGKKLHHATTIMQEKIQKKIKICKKWINDKNDVGWGESGPSKHIFMDTITV